MKISRIRADDDEKLIKYSPVQTLLPLSKELHEQFVAASPTKEGKTDVVEAETEPQVFIP